MVFVNFCLCGVRLTLFCGDMQHFLGAATYPIIAISPGKHPHSPLK
nr:MAG TPA: protein of unknown function (DUF4538) [Caudoviricetes sp.]